MSDNLRRYRAIRHALAQCYPTASLGNFARPLNTLAALLSGIVGSKSTQLPHIAMKVLAGTKPESRVKRFARWCDNAHLLEGYTFCPMRMSCCVISLWRRWCSSWMAAAGAAGGARR